MSAVKSKDIEEIKDLTTTKLTLSEAKNCLEICKSLDSKLTNQHENNLKLALYMWCKGNIERREKQIEEIKKKFKIEIPNYEIGESPFVDPKKTIKNGIQYIQSKITKLEYISLNTILLKNNELL